MMKMKIPETIPNKNKDLENNDECYTPEYAIIPLLPYLKKEWKIWDCAFGSGRLAENFKKNGFEIIGNDNLNFFDENLDCDFICTNPPYSKKDEFLERAFNIGKPFAFLLPTKALGEKKRNFLYRKFGIQLIIPDRRINFEIPSKKKAPWFHTSWFCYKMNLPKDLNFVEINP